MKKVICLCLIALLLMNVMGYYLVFLGYQIHSSRTLTASLDNNTYDSSSTITIKVPVSVPYVMDQDEFTRTDGQFLHEGKYYRLVKQKYSQDTLTVICIRDKHSEKIQNAFGHYAKSVADNSSGPNDSTKLRLSFIKDYVGSFAAANHAIRGWVREVERNTELNKDYTTSLRRILQPPQTSSSLSLIAFFA